MDDESVPDESVPTVLTTGTLCHDFPTEPDSTKCLPGAEA
jgi:hypothetical protein